MQGVYRIVLALMVVVYHLAHDQVWFAGNFAVLAFYALSGYLITGAVRENYGTDWLSLRRFAFNRFLRIFPGYWAALAVATVTTFSFPTIAVAINPVIRDPGEISLLDLPAGWIPQITMIGLQVPPATLWPIRLIPPSWSTCIELYFYALLALSSGLGDKAFTRVLAATAMSGLLCALTGQARWTYTSLFGVAVLFAAGSMAWRRRDRLDVILQARKWLVPACALTYPAIAFAPDVWRGLRHEAYLVWGQYLVVPLAAILAHASIATGMSIGRRLDGWLADLSYPVFLLHFPASVLVQGLTGLTKAEWVAASLAATFGLAWLVVAVVERPLTGLRRKLRQSTARPAPA